MKNVLIIVLSVLFIISCRKDTGKLPVSLPTLPEPEDTFVCEKRDIDTLPVPIEPPSGYDFANKYGKDGIVEMACDPNDKNVIYYTTLEHFNFNYLYKYNRKTGLKTLLDKNVLMSVSANKNGWLVYVKYDKNIYKIKTNGDSLKQLTKKGTCLNPAWNFEGNYVYYYDDGFISYGGNKVYKLNSNGSYVDTLKDISISSGVTETSDFLYYMKLEGSNFSIQQRNKKTGSERTVVSKQNNLGASVNATWFTDPEEQNIYWYQEIGLFKTSLSTLQTNLLIEARLGKYFLNHFNLSSSNRILCVQNYSEYVEPYTILSSSCILEFTLDGTCLRKVPIPD